MGVAWGRGYYFALWKKKRRTGCQLLGVVWVMGTCTHTHAHAHMHTHTCTHTHTHASTHTHAHACTHTHTSCTHIMHTCAYTHTLMHIPADVTTEGWLQQCILQAEISRETRCQYLHNSTIQTKGQGNQWAVYICLAAWLHFYVHVPVLTVWWSQTLTLF